MNGFPDTQTAEKFESDDYRILVVANKYLTGFDQPKLRFCSLYVICIIYWGIISNAFVYNLFLSRKCYQYLQTAEKFESDDYRILVVANKYLTGFDQPKLCAMYIDKPLDGVLAVQALSRLNRAAPDLGKLSEDLFVLDFYNKIEDIKEAFDSFTSSISNTPIPSNVAFNS